MIEQLAEHGVTAEDLVPSLVTTYTVPNPEYDPDATPDDLPEPASVPPPAYLSDSSASPSELPPDDLADKNPWPAEKELPQPTPEDGVADEAAAVAALAAAKVEKEERRKFVELEKGRVLREVEKIENRASLPPSPRRAASNPFGQETEDSVAPTLRSAAVAQPPPTRDSDPFDDCDDGGDIGGAFDGPTTPKAPRVPFSTTSPPRTPTTPTNLSPNHLSPVQSPPPAIRIEPGSEPESIPLPSSSTSPNLPPPSPSVHQPENFLSPLPSTLPGVSTTLTAADKTITLDIRWTILCDLFLSLIADSVYDARSRVLLGKVADKLGLEWMDVVRFERRMTEALEIQEGVKEKENGVVLEEQRKRGMRTRYMMMGLATLGALSPASCEGQLNFAHRRWTRYRSLGGTPRSSYRCRTRSSVDDRRRDGNYGIPGWSGRRRDHLVWSDDYGVRYRREGDGEADEARQDVRVPAAAQQQARQLLHHCSWVR